MNLLELHKTMPLSTTDARSPLTKKKTKKTIQTVKLSAEDVSPAGKKKKIWKNDHNIQKVCKTDPLLEGGGEKGKILLLWGEEESYLRLDHSHQSIVGTTEVQGRRC